VIAAMTDTQALQAQIAPIWTAALGIDRVGPDDNFFALGGHSLLAVKMLGAIQAKLLLDGELTLSDLVENPTLAGFCARLAVIGQPSEESGAI